jgi:hypothetical protein
MKSPIVIMTWQRASLAQQKTWARIPDDLRSLVRFACREDEAPFFESLQRPYGTKPFVLPSHVASMKETRQAIWDHFNNTDEFWCQIDDDTKKFLKLDYHWQDPEEREKRRKPWDEGDAPQQRLYEIHAKPRHQHSFDGLEAMFDRCIDVLKSNPYIGTVSPRQTFKMASPKTPLGDFGKTISNDPNFLGSAELCVGFNAFCSERNLKLNYEFKWNYCGDTGMIYRMLSQGYDTVYLRDYTIDQDRPTKGATWRKSSVEEFRQFREEYPNYFRDEKKIDDAVQSSDQPQKGWKMLRSKLLKDARKRLQIVV